MKFKERIKKASCAESAERAKQLCEAVLNQFMVKGEGIAFREYAPEKPGDRDTCYLWSYFAVSGMLYRLIKTGAGGYLEIYRKIIDGFLYYRTNPEHMESGKIKYHSERGEKTDGGHGPCFFDDNIWVARNYLFAYEVFQEDVYLKEAVRIVQYIYTGWNKELGGLVWNENGLTDEGTEQELERGLSANACCIIVNAELYRLKGEKGYLDWALRFYQFCKGVQDAETKIYYNGIHTIVRAHVRTSGNVNKDLYSYNSGSMILADLLLYKLTGRMEYKEDALLTAEAAHQAFLRQDAETGVSCYKDFVWFTAILAEGFEALAEEAPAAAEPYFAVLEQSLTYACEHYKKGNGLLPHDYAGGWRQDDDYDRMLLTQSGTAEIACLLAGRRITAE